MASPKPEHILGASTDLLGICFVLITGLKLTKASQDTLADEICFVAAFAFLLACLLSYISIRTERETGPIERVADYLFIGGMLLLFFAVGIFSTGTL